MKKIITILGAFLLAFAFATSVSAATFTIGNDANVRPLVDTYTNFTIVDTNNPSTAIGLINTFDYYAANTNPFRFVLINGSSVVQWVSDEITPVGVGAQTYSPASSVYTESGWNIGLYFAQSGTVPFAYTGDPAWYESNHAGLPVVGETLSYAGSSNRIYSFVATVLTDTDNDTFYSDVDCNDNDATIYPGATEVCDGVDNDCDVAVDEDLAALAADKQYGVCAGSLKVCAGASSWQEPDYTGITGYEATEVSCDTFDNDCDGTVDQHVCNWYCATPQPDVPTITLGTNRWVWYSGINFETVQPKGGGWNKAYTLAQTNNCSCSQILNQLNAYNSALYGDMSGHWKYGCSISVMNEFIRLINPYHPLTGQWLLSVNSGAYLHDMFITEGAGGVLTGTGGYPWTGPPYPYPYNWTLVGQVTGNAITMTITYQNGYTAAIAGTVTLDWNSMNGGAGTGGVFNWSATRQ